MTLAQYIRPTRWAMHRTEAPPLVCAPDMLDEYAWLDGLIHAEDTHRATAQGCDCRVCVPPPVDFADPADPCVDPDPWEGCDRDRRIYD